MQIPFKYKLVLGIAAGFAGLYLTILGVGLPLAKYIESRPEEYHATGLAGETVTVYSRPSMESKPVGTLNPLTAAEVVARKKPQKGSEIEEWYRLNLNGKEGWVPEMKYFSGFIADPSSADYVAMVSKNGQGSEGFYMSVFKGFNNNGSVSTGAMEIAAKELAKAGSKKAVPILQEICKTNASTVARESLEALGGSLRGCGR